MKMTSAEYSNEKLNHCRMSFIVNDVVSEGMRTFFKQEWDSLYQASLGAWDDTTVSGQELYKREQARMRSGKGFLLPELQSGNREKWDCTLLFYTILSSKSISPTLSPSIRKHVDDLRQIRNKFIGHAAKADLRESEFQKVSHDVLTSFVALGLPTAEIDKIRKEKSFPTGKLNREKWKKNLLLIISCVVLIIGGLCYTLISPTAAASFLFLPDLPSHEVIYRSNEVATIFRDLQVQQNTSHGNLTYFYISGNPGSGKSQLARQIGKQRHQQMSTSSSGVTFVMTFNAETKRDLLESYEGFARRLNCAEHSVTSVVNSSKTTEEKIRQLRSQIAPKIKNYKSWLIIVDNVVNLTVMSRFFPQLGNEDWFGGQLLITTQHSLVIPPNSSLTSHVSISEGMNAALSSQLLTRLSGVIDADDVAQIVAEKLDYQPLALAAAGVYVKRVRETYAPSEFSWEDYLKKLSEGKRNLTETHLRVISSAYSRTMTAAVLLAVEKEAETDPVLNYTFQFLSLVSREPLPLDVATNYVFMGNKDLDRDEVAVKIQKCSLFIPDDDEVVSFRLHSVVHDVIKLYVGEKMKDKIVCCLDNAARSLYIFKNKSLDRELVPHVKEFFAVTRNMPYRQKRALCSEPMIDGSEHRKIFRFFLDVLYTYGEFVTLKEFLISSALPLLHHDCGLCIFPQSKIEDIFDRMDGPSLYSHLGLVNLETGDLKFAKSCFDRVLAHNVKKYGPRNVRLATSYANLGRALLHLGDLKRAKQNFELALSIRLYQSEPNSSKVGVLYQLLGNVHRLLGNTSKAKEFSERALSTFIKLKSKCDHINIVSSYNTLGIIYRNSGNLQKARDYLEKAVTIFVKQRGSNHIVIATLYNNLGSIYLDLFNLKQAEQYFEKALDIATKRVGPNHPSVRVSYGYMGRVHNKLGSLEKAKRYYELGLQMAVEQLGPNHADVAAFYDDLGDILLRSGDLQKAKEYQERALNIRHQQFESDHPAIATSRGNLACQRKLSGDLQQAKEYYKLAEEIFAKKQASGIESTVLFNNFGDLLFQMGDRQQAKEKFERALNKSIEQFGFNHTMVATSYLNLGRVERSLGKLKKAKHLYENAHNILYKMLGSKDSDDAIYEKLGNVNQDLGNLQQAKQYYKNALRLRIKKFGSNHSDVATSYHNLGSIHRDLGDLSNAKRYLERALQIRIELLGSNHLYVGLSFMNLAVIHQRLGDLVLSRKYFEDTASVFNNTLGSNHILMAAIFQKLGSVNKELGTLQRAKQYYKNALRLRIKTFGSNHSDVATSYNDLGSIYRDLGDLSKAKRYYEHALQIRVKMFGSNHLDVGSTSLKLAVIHQRLGDLVLVREYLEGTASVFINTLGSNHTVMEDFFQALGSVNQKVGDLLKAKEYHERALYVRIQRLGSNHVDVASSYSNLGKVLEDLDQPRKAKEYHERSPDIRVKQLGLYHVNVATSFYHLGVVHQKLGNLQLAKQYGERGLEIRIKQLGPNDLAVALSYLKLAEVHASLGEWKLVLHYYGYAMDIYKKHRTFFK